MYGFMLFLHLGGLAIWLGSIFTVAMLLISLSKNIQSADVSAIGARTIKIFNRITHPSSFIVLLSGIIMLMNLGMENHDNFPFWLKFMEMAGSMVILVFIILLSIMGKKTMKRIQNATAEPAAAQKSIRTFVTTALIFVVLVLVVVFVVSAKL